MIYCLTDDHHRFFISLRTALEYLLSYKISVQITLDDQDGKEIEMTIGEKYHLPAGEFHTVHCLGDNPAMYMYIYQNSTDVEYRKKFNVLKEIDQYDSKDDLPQNLTNYFTPEEEAQLREYFYGSKSKEELKVARKENVVQFKKSFYGKTLYWCDKKIRNVRRGVLLGMFLIMFPQLISNIILLERLY